MTEPSDSPKPRHSAHPSSGHPSAGATLVDPKVLEILVCPLSKMPLRYDAKAGELISDRAGLAFPIRDGIPILLVDEARTLDP